VGDDYAELFGGIYAERKWYNGSGSGSQPANTEEYRHFLQDYLKINDIKSAVDVGCGDWKFSWLVQWPEDFSYLGIDVVDRVIRINRHDWTDWGVADIRFECADVLEMTELPPADLVLVKDIFQHWPNGAIRHLGSLLAGRRALITYDTMRLDISPAPAADPAPPVNADIPAGAWRPLALEEPPFGWPVKEQLTYVAPSLKYGYYKTVVELRP
jgi:SAM-dependent methyltransferase